MTRHEPDADARWWDEPEAAPPLPPTPDPEREHTLNVGVWVAGVVIALMVLAYTDAAGWLLAVL